MKRNDAKNKKEKIGQLAWSGSNRKRRFSRTAASHSFADSRYGDAGWIPDCIETELHEYHHVFGHGAQRTNQPGEIGEDVVFLGGVAENL